MPGAVPSRPVEDAPDQDLIFLDSAGSSLPAPGVTEVMLAHLRREAEVGGYAAAAERAGELDWVRDSVAAVLGAPRDAVALSDSATRAWTQFFWAVPLGPGDRVVLTQAEYGACAANVWHRAAAEGFAVTVVPAGPDGLLDPERFADALDDRVRLVSLVHVASSSGVVQPVAELAGLARARGALVLLDACQSVGQLALDVGRLGVDALAGGGRKWLRGPRGTGFLYLRPGVEDRLRPAALDLTGADLLGADLIGAGLTGVGVIGVGDRVEVHPGAARFELAECSMAARLGLGAAADHLLALGPAAVEQSVRAKAGRLRAGLAAQPGVQVHEAGRSLGGIVTFSVAGREAAEVKAALAAERILLSVSPGSSTPYDLGRRGLSAVVRASPHYFVPDDLLDEAARTVGRLARG